LAIDLVIDADGHCSEPAEDLTPWLPRELHHRAPTTFKNRAGSSGLYIEGRLSTEAAGIPLSVHPQTGHDGQYGVWGTMGAGSERMEKYSYVHMTAFSFEPMIALMHMIGEGVFDRYPRLKVAYVEGAFGWLPFWAQRLDEHFAKLRPQWPHCQRKPSEIIAGGQVALTCEPEEETLPDVLETMGQHLVMYASDYPHWDCEYPESVRIVARIPGLSEGQKRRVLGRNAVEWFGLQPQELPQTSVYFGRQNDAAVAAGDQQTVHQEKKR
jgi:predicted TIM-barrel fold metal-dependent hydrolase